MLLIGMYGTSSRPEWAEQATPSQQGIYQKGGHATILKLSSILGSSMVVHTLGS